MTNIVLAENTKKVRASLDKVSEHIVSMLPAAFKSQHKRFIDRAALTFSTSKAKDKLRKCTMESVIASVVTAAEYGFSLDDRFVYAIPYHNTIKGDNGRETKVMECTATFDYKALVAVARRHRLVLDVRAQDVREGDEFDWYEEDFRQRYRFRKGVGDRGKFTGAFAVVAFPGGTFRFEHMGIDELAKVRSASKSSDSPAWQNWENRMYCKAVVKRTLTYVQDDPTLGSLIDRDNKEYDMDKVIDAVSVSPARLQTMDDLASQLAPKKAIEQVQEQQVDFGKLLSRATTAPALQKVIEQAEASKTIDFDTRVAIIDEAQSRIEIIESENQEG